MNFDTCPKNERVLAALRANVWPEELRAHVESCASCRETSRVAAWMTRLAADVEALPGAPPAADLIWLKAKIGRRSRTPARALLPIKIGGLLGGAGCGLLFAGWLRDNWVPPPVSSWSHLLHPVSIGAWLESRSLPDWKVSPQLLELLSAVPPTSWLLPVGAILLYFLLFARERSLTARSPRCESPRCGGGSAGVRGGNEAGSRAWSLHGCICGDR